MFLMWLQLYADYATIYNSIVHFFAVKIALTTKQLTVKN